MDCCPKHSILIESSKEQRRPCWSVPWEFWWVSHSQFVQLLKEGSKSSGQWQDGEAVFELEDASIEPKPPDLLLFSCIRAEDRRGCNLNAAILGREWVAF